MTKIDPTKLIGRKVIGEFTIYLMYAEVQNTFNILLRNRVEEREFYYSDPVQANYIFEFLKTQSIYVLGVMIQE